MVHPEDIHLTLVFLGQATLEQRACIQRAADLLRAEPFELVLDRIGCFPRARVLWCGADICPPPLEELVGSLSSALEPCGFAAERRRYLPHATLVRKSIPVESRPLEQSISWRVDGFVLACGQNGPPPRYRILRRWPLGSGRDALGEQTQQPKGQPIRGHD
jgi:2'-5' RNA ligase